MVKVAQIFSFNNPPCLYPKDRETSTISSKDCQPDEVELITIQAQRLDFEDVEFPIDFPYQYPEDEKYEYRLLFRSFVPETDTSEYTGTTIKIPDGVEADLGATIKMTFEYWLFARWNNPSRNKKTGIWKIYYYGQITCNVSTGDNMADILAAINEHNTSPEAHADIRQILEDVKTQIEKLDFIKTETDPIYTADKPNLATKNSVVLLEERVTDLEHGGMWRGLYQTYAEMLAANPNLVVASNEWHEHDWVEVQADESTIYSGHVPGNPSSYIVVKGVDNILRLQFRRDLMTPVPKGSNSKLGVVQGSLDEGKVSINDDGLMSVNGFTSASTIQGMIDASIPIDTSFHLIGRNLSDTNVATFQWMGDVSDKLWMFVDNALTIVNGTFDVVSNITTYEYTLSDAQLESSITIYFSKTNTPISFPNDAYYFVTLSKAAKQVSVYHYVTTSGSASAYTADIANFELVNGAEVYIKPHINNTAGCTLNISGTGDIPISRSEGITGLSNNDLIVGYVYNLVYDQTANLFYFVDAWSLVAIKSLQDQIDSTLTQVNNIVSTLSDSNMGIVAKPEVFVYDAETGVSTFDLANVPKFFLDVLILQDASFHYLQQEGDYTISGQSITIVNPALVAGDRVKVTYVI